MLLFQFFNPICAFEVAFPQATLLGIHTIADKKCSTFPRAHFKDNLREERKINNSTHWDSHDLFNLSQAVLQPLPISLQPELVDTCYVPFFQRISKLL